MDQNGPLQAKMDHFGPFWSRECQNPVRNKVILTKMVVGTILDHFGPVLFPTVPRPLPILQTNYCTRNSRKNAIALRPLRAIASHELLHERCVPKTLAFAFGLRLRSKTWCFKTRVLGRRLPNGKPQERLRFRALRSKTLAFKKRIAIIFCDLKTSLGARACV